MKNIFIINGHQYYEFSKGQLNTTLVSRAQDLLTQKGHTVKVTTMADEYRVDEEVAKHQWADVVLLQSPINWMGVSWSFKRYIDLVYTQGMQGSMSAGDGRSTKAPKQNYGMGGLLKGRYMLSLTCNAPQEAFNNPGEPFFGGLSEDDLFRPMHLNFKWFGLQPMETFVAYDVMKNPVIGQDLQRFEAHLNKYF